MAIVGDDAVCIRHWDWSETSQTVALFTKQHGIIRGIAKGSKREKAPYSGGIELLTRGGVMMSIKKTDALTLLTAWDLSETFATLRASLPTFYAAMALAELLGQSMQPNDPHPIIYSWTLRSLRLLCADANTNLVLLDALIVILQETGLAPNLSNDVLTGKDWGGEVIAHGLNISNIDAAETKSSQGSQSNNRELVHFFPGLGGASVLPFDSQSRTQESWKMRKSTLDWLAMRWVQTCEYAGRLENPQDPGFTTFDEENVFLPYDDNQTPTRALRLLIAYIQYTLGVQGNATRAYVELMFPRQ